jgi:hypothetical protein
MSKLETVLKSGATSRTLSDIPLCFDDAAQVKKKWQLEALVLINQCENAAQSFAESARAPGQLRATRDRLKKYAEACRAQAACLKALLSPLNLGGIQPVELQAYLKMIKYRQSELGQYFSNLFRDWSWGEKENTQAFETLKSLLPASENQCILFMGSGGSRLAYDYHCWAQPALTVANDINPLLLLVAKQVVEGQTLEMVEVPALAVDENSWGVKRSLKAPQPADDKLKFVLGDATSGIFKDHSFDHVVTHWFIDDCGRTVQTLFPKINAILKPGGTWVNIGPLMYRGGFAQQYSARETVELAERCGFKVDQTKEELVPYLHSPLNRSQRLETVLSFRATKTADCDKISEAGEEIKPAVMPWLIDTTVPVPMLSELPSAAQATGLIAAVFGSIDGKASISEIEKKVVKLTNVSPQIASSLVTKIVYNLFETRAVNPFKT